MATILIVDDHLLKMVHAAHPDLVITGILMQDMDGYEFVNPLREAVGANGAGRI